MKAAMRLARFLPNCQTHWMIASVGEEIHLAEVFFIVKVILAIEGKK